MVELADDLFRLGRTVLTGGVALEIGPAAFLDDLKRSDFFGCENVQRVAAGGGRENGGS